MITELLAQAVEELSIRNARHSYRKPRSIPRPEYTKGGQKPESRVSDSAPNPYRSAMNRLLAHKPSRAGESG